MTKIIWNPLRFDWQLQENQSSSIEIVSTMPTNSEIEEIRGRIERKSILPLNMYVMLTYECNLGCDYCYISEQRQTAQGNIDAELAIKSIQSFNDLVINHDEYSGEDIRVLLFGGEPGIARKELLDILDFLNRKKENISPLLFTNGYSLDDEILNCIDGTKTHVVVSIDGPPWISNQTRRIAVPGSDTGIEERILHLSQRDIGWEIDMVLSPLVIDNFDDVIDYMNGFNPQLIGANMMTGFSGKYTKDRSINLQDYSNLILSNFFRIVDKGVKIYQIWPQFESFRNKSPNTTYMCEIVGGKTVLDVNLSWVPCEFFIGSKVDLTGLNQYLELSKSLKAKHPAYKETCYPCHSLGICGGGCTYLSHKEGKGIDGIDNATCYFNRKFGEMLIKHEVENGRSI